MKKRLFSRIVAVFLTLIMIMGVLPVDVTEVYASALPGVPVLNTASDITSSSFKLTWQAVDGADTYILDVSTSADFSGYVSGYEGKDLGNVTSYAVTGLNAETQYYCRLCAKNSYGASEYSNVISVTPSTVALTVNSMPKAEVALAVGNTKVNYAAFEQDLKAALEAKGIDEGCLSFVKVDANASTSQDSFTWWTYDHTYSTGTRVVNHSTHTYIEQNGSSSSSTNNSYDGNFRHISTSNNGATMSFYGYGQYGYKDFQYLPNEQATKKTIEFTIQEGAAYDALDGIGFLVNTSITGTYDSGQKINGYLVFFQYGSGGKGESIKIFQLTNVDAKSFHHSSAGVNSEANTFAKNSNISVEGVTYLASATTSYPPDDTVRNIKIEVMPEYVKIWYDNSEVKWNVNGISTSEYPLTSGYDGDTYRGGYGPLISYRGHNCSRTTLFTVTNLKMTAEYVRSLTEVVREPSWSDEKVSFLVNLNEAPIADFSDQYSTAEIINRLQDDNVSYIGWCGTNNANDSLQFVNGVGNDSGLVNMNDTTRFGSDPYSATSYQKQIDAIADIIFNKLSKQTEAEGVHTFLTTDNFKFQSYNARLDDGNWSVGYSGENFLLAKENVSTYQNLGNASFLQAGYYEVYYNGDTEHPKARIRIHQAPIALLNASLTSENAIQVINKSYDPDVCDNAATADGTEASGIVNSVIEYRNLSANNAEWTEEAPASVQNGQNWLVRVTVTDADGATASAVQQVSANTEAKAPYGSFRLSSTQYFKGIDENLQIIDQSYTLAGDTDGLTVSYVIKNSAGTTIWSSSADSSSANYVAPGATYNYPLSSLGEGTYTVSMTATQSGATSETVSRTFKVVQAYKITYDAGEGTGAPATQYKIKGQTLLLSNIAPTREGYTFAGWSYNGTTYQPGQSYTSDAALTLSAIWAKNMTYTASGYSGVYDGQNHGIAINVQDPDSDYTITYGTVDGTYPSNTALVYSVPGTYTVYFRISKDGYRSEMNSRLVVIDKITPVITLSSKVVPYDGTARTVDGAVIGNVYDSIDSSIVYTYYMDAACTTLTTGENSGAASEGAAPVNEGVYYVKASFVGNACYNAAVSNVTTLTIETYTVHFNMNGLGTQIDDVTKVVGGTTIAEPAVPTSETHMFIGWYHDAACLTPWNFALDSVNGNTTIYAKWKAKSEYEVRWEKDGEWYYGTFEEAMEAGSTNIVIQNDKTLGNVEIPEGVTVTVDPGAIVTITEDLTLNGTLKNQGTIINHASVSGSGSLDNQGTIDNTDGSIGGGETPLSIQNETDGVITGGQVNGNVTNDGTIEDSTVGGNVDNTNGTIDGGTIAPGTQVTGGTVEGDVINQGNLQNTQMKGNIDNTNGTVTGGTVEPGAGVTGGTVAGDVTNQGIIKDSNIAGNVQNENGTVSGGAVSPDGKVTGGNVVGNVTNRGAIEGSNISGKVDNTDGTIGNSHIKEGAQVTGGEITGNTKNDGIIKDSTVKGALDNTDGVMDGGTVAPDSSVTGGTVTGDVENQGNIKDADIAGNVDNTNGTVTGGTVKPSGTVTGGTLGGDVKNDGTIQDSNITGNVDNTNGTVTGGTVGEDASVTGGKVAGDVTNHGNIQNADIAGNVNNQDGTVTGGSVEPSGKISGGTVAGDVTNHGNIQNSNITGTVDNTDGTVTGGTITPDGTVAGGTVAGDVKNDGTIQNSNITGNVDNKNGSITDGTVAENASVSGGNINGSVTNKGTIQDSNITGTVQSENGTVSGGHIATEATVIGGRVAGNVINEGMINGSSISGSVNNENGVISSGVLERGAEVTGGVVAGTVENQGTIRNSKITGTVSNASGRIEGGTIQAGARVSGGVLSGNIVDYNKKKIQNFFDNLLNDEEEQKIVVPEEAKSVSQGQEVQISHGLGKISIAIEVSQEDELSGKGSISGVILTDTDQVLKACLTPEELKAIWNGEVVSIKLSVTRVVQEKDVPVDDKAKIEDTAAKEGMQLGTYVDLLVMKKIGTNDWEYMSNLQQDIEIVLDIPEELRFENVVYSIIRCHDGTCTVLEDLDEEPDTITIRTGMFSTYAIVYEAKEVVEVPENDMGILTEGDTDVCSLCGRCSAPLHICIFIWITIGILALIAVVLTLFVIYTKRENHNRQIRK